MQQLTGLDASFLNTETPETPGHVSGVTILDPSTAPVLSNDEMMEIAYERLHLNPRGRSRVVEVPYGLDHPWFVEDENFDFEYHTKFASLPGEGTWADLQTLVSQLIAYPLDRNRPLYETWLIEGLPEGKVAMLAKTHHCNGDGGAGTEALDIAFDLTPEFQRLTPEPWEPDPMPRPEDLLVRAAQNNAARAAAYPELVRRTMAAMAAIPQGGVDPVVGAAIAHGFGIPTTEVTGAAPMTPLNRMVGFQRRWAFRSVSIERFRAVKKAAGCTINDVVMAMSAAALRRWLERRNALPDQSLRAAVPVNTRTTDQYGSAGNRVSTIVGPLGTHIADPLDRLRAINAAMNVAKANHSAFPTELEQAWIDYNTPNRVQPAVLAAYQGRNADREAPAVNVTISNVPGPMEPRYSIGSRIERLYPASMIGHGAGLNITVQSYDGRMDFGLIADRDLVPDLDDVMTWMVEGLEELERALFGRADGAEITIDVPEALVTATPNVGNGTDSVGNGTDSVGNGTDSVGNDTDAVGNGTDSVGNDTNSVGNGTDAVGNDTAAVGDDAETTMVPEPASAGAAA